MQKPVPRIVGRAAQSNPPSRFDNIVLEDEPLALYDDLQEGSDRQGPDSSAWSRKVATQYIRDESKTIISENTSPDLNFRYSLNPYRGCAHGCSYCYARTYHEYLGYSAGTDFESTILYKPDAASLFRQWLDRKRYQCEPVNFSGATDCYQPVEREYQLTRQCLQVALRCRQPVTIVTKNALVLRDLDLLVRLAELRLVHVNISITSLDQSLIALMEPRTSCPATRLKAIRVLSENHIPVRALLSPVIPGLTDSELPKLIQAASDAGAQSAGSTVVRLPGNVERVFFEWLQATLPQKQNIITSRIRQIRNGDLHDSQFGTRMSGTGEMARQIRNTFQVFARKYGLDNDLPPLETQIFVRPGDQQQKRLF